MWYLSRFGALLCLLFLFFSCDSASPPSSYSVSLSSSPDSAASVSVAQSEVEEGSQIQVEAEVYEGWSFTEWTGDLSEVNELEATVTVDSKIDATAQFKRKKYDLSVSTQGEGSVVEEVVKTKDTYEHGTVVRLTAEPDSGWTFASWSGDLSGGENPDKVTIEGERSITATFEKQRHSVEGNSEGDGSVSKTLVIGDHNSEGYTHGSEVEFTATPSDGWAFSNWQGSLSGTHPTDTLKVDEDESVTAIFKELHSVSTSTEGEGSVSTDPSGGQQLEGTVVRFDADPAQGWKFDHWGGDLSGTETPDSLEVRDPVSVTAVFEQEQYTVNVGKTGQGTINFAPQRNTYAYGDTIALEASPQVGYPETSADAWELNLWIGSTVTGYEATHTVTGDANITAEFKTYEELIGVGYWLFGNTEEEEGFDVLEVNIENSLRRPLYVDQVEVYDESGSLVVANSIDVLLFQGEGTDSKTEKTRFDLPDPPMNKETLEEYTTLWDLQYTRPDGLEVVFDHYLEVSDVPGG